GLISSIFLQKKFPDIILMMYFLDTISSGTPPKFLTKKWLLKRGLKWENYLFSWADIIFILEAHRDHFLKPVYKIYREKIRIVDIPLVRSLEKKNIDKDIIESSKIKLVFTGTLLKNVRNPQYFLDLF